MCTVQLYLYTRHNVLGLYQKMTIPSFVSLSDELDVDLGFADLCLSFLISGEEERLTEKGNKEEKAMAATQVGKNAERAGVRTESISQ